MSIEAGATIGWAKYVGDHGIAFGLDHFGTSAPAADIAKEYGFTPEHVADVAAGLLANVSRKKIMANQLQELLAAGQSIWLDNIRRSMFASGELQRLIDLGLRGMTSNPTIFEKAIGSGTDYDEQLRMLVARRRPDASCSRRSRSATSAARATCSHRVCEETNGLDGYVSLEVSPTLAHDTDGHDRGGAAAVEGASTGRT